MLRINESTKSETYMMFIRKLHRIDFHSRCHSDCCVIFHAALAGAN